MVPWRSHATPSPHLGARSGRRRGRRRLGAAACSSGGAAASAEAAGGSIAATTVVAASPEPVTSPSPAASSELAGWSNRRLAAQLVFCSVPATNPLAGKKWARMGVGGIVILGAGARSGIGGDLAAVLRAAPNGIRPFIASDEEGGLVQRLRDVIYPLPSAHVQGTWSASKTRAAAEAYGKRMRKLNVAVDFAPVADLDIPGRFISGQQRAFSRDPGVVGSHVVAWVKGLRRRASSRPSSTGRATAGRRTRTPARHASPRSRCCAATTWCRSRRPSTPACPS